MKRLLSKLKQLFCKHSYIEKYEHYYEYWFECTKCKKQVYNLEGR